MNLKNMVRFPTGATTPLSIFNKGWYGHVTFQSLSFRKSRDRSCSPSLRLALVWTNVHPTTGPGGRKRWLYVWRKILHE